MPRELDQSPFLILLILGVASAVGATVLGLVSDRLKQNPPPAAQSWQAPEDPRHDERLDAIEGQVTALRTDLTALQEATRRYQEENERLTQVVVEIVKQLKHSAQPEHSAGPRK